MVDYNRLRGALAEKRLTQKEIAEHIGCTPQAISYKLAGKSPLTIRDVTIICQLIKATPDERDSIFFA